MKRIPLIIVSIIITFIFNLILQTASQYLSRDLGSVTGGSPINIKGQVFFPLDIYNYDNKPLENLWLSIPTSSSIQEIISSKPIQIAEIPTTIGVGSVKKNNNI